MKEFILILLKKCLKFLAKLTVWRYQPGIIGVTGNTGKTSTKEAIALVLSQERDVRSSSKSFNNEIGLPLAILGDWSETGGPFFWLKVIFQSLFHLIFKDPRYPEILVLEYGIDKPKDMDYLLKIAQPTIGVFTAIGEIPVHVEFFGSREEVLKEKSKLITQLPSIGLAVLNADDPSILELKSKTKAQTISFGFSELADVRITNFENKFNEEEQGVVFKLNYGGNFVPVKINGVLGKGIAYASGAAAVIGLAFGLNLVKISEALALYEPPPGRMRVLKGIKNTFIIDDTYNASFLAMDSALETLKSLKAKRKIAVLGDMLEIGKYTFEAHDRIGKKAAKIVDILFTVGIRGKIIAEAAKNAGFSKRNLFHFETLKGLGNQLQLKIKPGDVILIKASQAVRLEKIVEEIMAEPNRAKELLVRQDKRWLSKSGIYDEEIAPIV